MEEKKGLSDEEYVRKREAILEACKQSSFEQLAQLANSTGGLLEDQLRGTAWPILLGCSRKSNSPGGSDVQWKTLAAHADEEQVQKDVDRAFVYYPKGESEKAIEARKAKLYDLIVQTLRCHPMLCYFQGYHDIVQVLFLVLGEQSALEPVVRLSLLRIRDFMLPSLSPALKHLHLLPAILQLADEELATHIAQTGPNFALAATLTLYAHDIQDYGDIVRLFDFILAHEPVMTLYLFAAIIISNRSKILEIPTDEPDILQVTLSRLPHSFDLEALISKSTTLYTRCPPEKLPGLYWWRISSLSVLKTSRHIQKPQSIADAQNLFQKQVKQLRIEELLQKSLVILSRKRRPIGRVATALLVGVFSIWLRRTGNDRVMLSLIWKTWESFR